jgi:WD40 repeat protein
MEGEKKLLTASGDQTCALWDVIEEEKLSVFKGHTSSVKSVEFRPQDRCTFASGARDGKIMLWDNRCGSLGMFLIVCYVLVGVKKHLIVFILNLLQRYCMKLHTLLVLCNRHL